MSDLETLVVIVAMTVVTVVSRSFFFISRREWPLPTWAARGLRYAPVAALSAVVAPSVLMDGANQFVATWQDARLVAAAVALAFFLWRRSMFGTIAVGMAVYMPLHVGLGW